MHRMRVKVQTIDKSPKTNDYALIQFSIKKNLCKAINASTCRQKASGIVKVLEIFYELTTCFFSCSRQRTRDRQDFSTIQNFYVVHANFAQQRSRQYFNFSFKQNLIQFLYSLHLVIFHADFTGWLSFFRSVLFLIVAVTTYVLYPCCISIKDCSCSRYSMYSHGIQSPDVCKFAQ